MAYGNFEALPRRATCDKVLTDKAFNITKNAKSDGNQRSLASMVYSYFDIKTFVCALKNGNMPN